MDSDEDILKKATEAAARFTEEESNDENAATVKAVQFLCSCHQFSGTNAELWRKVVAIIERSELFKFWRRQRNWIEQQGLEEIEGSAATVINWYLFSIIWNLTDCSSKVCESAIEAGLIQAYLEDLRKPQFLAARTEETGQSIYQHFAAGCIETLINLAERCFDQTVCLVTSENGVDIIHQYLATKHDFLRVRAIILISNFLTGDEKDKLTTVLRDEDVAYIVAILKDAFAAQDHLSSSHSRHALETLNAIARISNLSESFVASLIKYDFMTKAQEVLKAPDVAPIEDCEKTYSTVEEKISLAKTLWSFTFYEAGRQALLADADLRTSLELTASKGATNQLKLAASGVLWELKKFAENAQVLQLDQSAPANYSATASGHVMLSYCWDASKPIVLRMKDYLKARKVPIWMDVEDMRGSTVEAMAAAVEQSAIVLMCYGQGYSQSANCRAEAMYAFSMRKNIVPVRMHDYKPKGWLGFIIGTALYYDMSDPSKFDEVMPKLYDAIAANLQLNTQSDEVDALVAPDTAINSDFSPTKPLLSTNVEQWTTYDVQLWMNVNNLKANSLHEADGKRLRVLAKMLRQAPSYLYERLEQKLHMDFWEVVDFVHALENLGI